ncbi:MAG: hypothetical protein KDB14_26890 [Planctomycetales bacterium]|nr:hypothetical protein [Planctomycetales bacterium]
MWNCQGTLRAGAGVWIVANRKLSMQEIYNTPKYDLDPSIQLPGAIRETSPCVTQDRMPRHFDDPPPVPRLPPRHFSVDDLQRGKPEAVFMPDNRLPIADSKSYPYSAICALTIINQRGEKFYGSGFLAGPRLVLTAGHNVYYHSDGGFMKEIVVYPGLHLDYTAHQPRAVSTSFSTVASWTLDANRQFDFGAIFLDADLTASTGFLAVSKFKSEELQNMTVNLVGYPKDPPEGQGFPNDGSTQWRASGRVAVAANQLTYGIDSSAGQSGSPLIAYFSETDAYHVVGIHNTAFPECNAATRFNDEVFSQIVRWRQKSDPAA